MEEIALCMPVKKLCHTSLLCFGYLKSDLFFITAAWHNQQNTKTKYWVGEERVLFVIRPKTFSLLVCKESNLWVPSQKIPRVPSIPRTKNYIDEEMIQIIQMLWIIYNMIDEGTSSDKIGRWSSTWEHWCLCFTVEGFLLTFVYHLHNCINIP